MRNFADFAALPTASGLVITPYADDLQVTRRHRARHHRPARRPGPDAAADAGGAIALGAGALRRRARPIWISRIGARPAAAASWPPSAS